MHEERPCRCPLAMVCSRSRGPFREIRRKQHHILYLQGEAAERVYFLQRGSVSLHRMGAEHHALGRTRALRQQGAFVGIEALVDNEYQDSARAETELLLCAAGREQFSEWMGPRDTPGYRVLESVLRTEDDERPRQAAPDGTAVQRVASWLLDRRRLEHTTRIPRTVHADLLGIRPETLSRALHSLADAGLIEVSRSSLCIVDPEGLRKLLPA